MCMDSQFIALIVDDYVRLKGYDDVSQTVKIGF